MAHAIRYRDGFAGCANGATANAVRSKVLLTSNSERIVGTPKSSVVTIYRIAGSGDELLVANTHGMNLAGKFTHTIAGQSCGLAISTLTTARRPTFCSPRLPASGSRTCTWPDPTT